LGHGRQRVHAPLNPNFSIGALDQCARKKALAQAQEPATPFLKAGLRPGQSAVQLAANRSHGKRRTSSGVAVSGDRFRNAAKRLQLDMWLLCECAPSLRAFSHVTRPSEGLEQHPESVEAFKKTLATPGQDR
jgi:hypothetical protein